jgi:hypothetical protein
MAGLVLIERENWRAYYPLFALACVNRETSCFLVFAFGLLLCPRKNWRWLGLHVAVQSAIWLSNKFVMTRLFIHNLGEKVFENHFASNAEFVLRIVRAPLESIDWIVLTFGWMAVLIILGWRVQPCNWKRLLLIVPPFLLGMSMAGDFGQIRIHNELVPLLLAPALWSIEAWRRARFSAHG